MHATARGGRRLGAVVAAIVALPLGLGAGVAAAWGGAGELFVAAATPTPTETPMPPLPSASIDPAPPRTCSITGTVTQPNALDAHGLVENAETGEVLFDYGAEQPTPTASVMKLVTATTAMYELGPDTRFETKVYPGETEGTYVLVGGGDPTLRAGGPSVYGDRAPSLDDLAGQLRERGIRVQRIGYDESLFTGAQWHPSWHEHDRADGAVGDVSALMVDAGRQDPAAHYSPRTRTPAQDATNAFAQKLGVANAGAQTPKAGSEPVATVQSVTVRDLVHELLLNSDNIIGEALARHVAISRGTGSDFAAISEAQVQVLRELEVPTDAFNGADGSGMSLENRATALTIMGIVELIQRDEHGLGELREYLPQNQISGTLKDRLPGIPSGQVQAKTGWTDEVFGLAGFMTLADGTRLRFAVFVAIPPAGGQRTTLDNRDALDAIITDIYQCGTGLRGSIRTVSV